MNVTTYADGSESTFVTTQQPDESTGELYQRMTATAIAQAKGREVVSMTNQRMGRNDLCLCRSGKKFKRCCGRTSVLD